MNDTFVVAIQCDVVVKPLLSSYIVL